MNYRLGAWVIVSWLAGASVSPIATVAQPLGNFASVDDVRLAITDLGASTASARAAARARLNEWGARALPALTELTKKAFFPRGDGAASIAPLVREST